MSKLIFFNIPASGHINPTIGVIRELVARGETVICVNTEETRGRYADTGADFIAYPNLDLTESAINSMSNSQNLMDNGITLAEIGERIAPWCVDLIRDQQPDFVIFDSLASWAKQAAITVKTRSIASTTTFAISFKAAKMPIGEMARAMFDMAVRIPRYNRIMARVKKAGIVAPVPFLTIFGATGDLNMVYTSSAFQPEAESFGATYRFVGPVIEPRPPMPDFPLDQIVTAERPVIYISLGTVKNRNIEFYRACFEAFKAYPALFVMSVGEHVDSAALGSAPDNFLIRQRVPQLDVLQHVDLFITHGGMNSVHEGLYYGVPLVVVPQQAEQLIVARRVKAEGAGVLIEGKPGDSISAETLRSAVENIAVKGIDSPDNPYRRAAVRIGETLKAAGGAKRAADEIQAFAANDRP